MVYPTKETLDGAYDELYKIYFVQTLNFQATSTELLGIWLKTQWGMCLTSKEGAAWRRGDLSEKQCRKECHGPMTFE